MMQKIPDREYRMKWYIYIYIYRNKWVWCKYRMRNDKNMILYDGTIEWSKKVKSKKEIRWYDGTIEWENSKKKKINDMMQK